MNIDQVLSARWGNDEHTYFVITVVTNNGRKCDLSCRWDSEDAQKRDLAQRAMGGEYGEVGHPDNTVKTSPTQYYDSLIGRLVRKDPKTGKWFDGLGIERLPRGV